MNQLSETAKASEKRSLMNSLENLNRKVYELEDLNNLSYSVVKKFTDPHPEPAEEKKMCDNTAELVTESPDLIDLFNQTIETINNNINSIESHLHTILDIIG